MFDGKTILVTGGTGSFGNAFVQRMLETHDDFKQVVIFSRDEKKQHDMRLTYHHPRLKFIIGDVRDRRAILNAMKDVNYVFHAAALKHVPSCEFFPMEAIQTNVLGSSNVLEAAGAHDVERVVVLSTDKAVYPINVLGMTKALTEKLMVAKAMLEESKTVFCAVRYGNVMYSRGSVIPLFVRQIQTGQPLTITNPDMTRFLLPLRQAVDLVLFAIGKGSPGDVFVRKAPASTIADLARACLNIFRANNEIRMIGIREGEKVHETLVTREELFKAQDYEDYYRILSDHSMDYEKYFSIGRSGEFPMMGYTSKNTTLLSVPQIEDLLLSLPEIREALKGTTPSSK
ncbi:polysaccharide biosynthesis protein [bacterium]|nr:polysaccharide biosynthesis protein [bacterium]